MTRMEEATSYLCVFASLREEWPFAGSAWCTGRERVRQEQGAPHEPRPLPSVEFQVPSAKAKASCRTRTDDRRFTKPLLYH